MMIFEILFLCVRKASDLLFGFTLNEELQQQIIRQTVGKSSLRQIMAQNTDCF